MTRPHSARQAAHINVRERVWCVLSLHERWYTAAAEDTAHIQRQARERLSTTVTPYKYLAKTYAHTRTNTHSHTQKIARNDTHHTTQCQAKYASFILFYSVFLIYLEFGPINIPL